VRWEAPVALLFIDALHDYEHVRADFEHYAPSVVASGLVAFHDYGSACPGVRRCVDEVLLRGGYRLAACQDTLIVVERESVTNG
jgi:methyltransferase family protein